MFEPNKLGNGTETRPFLPWFAGLDVSGEYGQRATKLMSQAAAAEPSLKAWHTTPQGGPWHCEGPVVADHVRRMFTGLFALEKGASLANIEEFAREKDLALDIADLEMTLRMHSGLLAAFALTHDAGKSSTLSFDAVAGSRGVREGFATRRQDVSHVASPAEKARYDKLVRAYQAAHPTLNTIDTMVGFYEEYGIATHYLEHEVVAATLQAERSTVLSLLNLPHSHHKLLTELIRYHIDTLHSFSDKADAKKYEVLAARAGKAGLNVDVFLDLVLAVAFLDAVLGSVGVKDGRAVAQTGLMINILRAEREAWPKRHTLREERAASSKKQAYKEALAKAGLDGESVFALLGTPLGPERGVVMGHVMSAIKDQTYRLDVGPHTAELAHRIARARTLLEQLRTAL